MIRALIIDDSALAREVLSELLRMAGIECETAPNADIGAEKIRKRRPDVVVLDLELPGTSGLTFLERQMASDPLPIVVCSGIAQPGARVALRALELGALEVVPKPDIGVRALLDRKVSPIAEAVRGVARARVQRRAPAPRPFAAPAAAVGARVHRARPARSVVLVGASTGGTEAVRTVLLGLPDDGPALVIVQHMPGAFTGAFAERLDADCPMRVRLAEDGMGIERGTALIAPGGRQIEVRQRADGPYVRVFDGPLVSGHRPSADSLFHSAADVFGARSIGVLLTGMGADGAHGLLRLRQSGAHTIAQDEHTCVVFGMPREAIAIGAAAEVLPLERIARSLWR